MRAILLRLLGGVFLLLGGIGIFLPLLPTTPFVLCAAWCFGRSSPALAKRLEESRYFGAYIQNYRLGTGIYPADRRRALVFLWLTLGISALFWQNAHGGLFLALVGTCVTIHLYKIKTRREEAASMRSQDWAMWQIAPAEGGDFFAIQRFFHENGLEVSLDSHVQPENVLGLWSARDAGGELLGAVKLERRAGDFVVGCIAVAESCRRDKLGTALLQTALQRCAYMSARRVLLVAKVPAFFKAQGFYQVPMEEYRAISKCCHCRQRGESCHPQVLRLDF